MTSNFQTDCSLAQAGARKFVWLLKRVFQSSLWFSWPQHRDFSECIRLLKNPHKSSDNMHKQTKLQNCKTDLAFGIPSICSIRSLVVPKLSSRILLAVPSFFAVSSWKRGTIRAPVAIAINSSSTPPTHRTAGIPKRITRDQSTPARNMADTNAHEEWSDR